MPLRRIARLLLVACLAALPAAAETFRNATAGIAIERPSGWHTLSVQQLEESRDRTRLQDRELQAALRRHATAPLFVFAKHPEPHDELNPTIQVKLRPLGGLAGAEPTRVLQAAVAPMRAAFRDFRLEQPVRETAVSGIPAASLVARYSVASDEGREFAVKSRIWVVPRRSFVVMIGMSGPPQGPDASEREFRAALDSVVIDR